MQSLPKRQRMSAPSVPKFEPHPWLRHPHAMTLAAAFWPRHLSRFHKSGVGRLFQVEKDSQVLGHCHWQNKPLEHSTLVIVHGLEGSSQSSHVLGLAFKAHALSMNVVRLNLRNCGGTIHLTPTLYNAGLSADLISVLTELKEQHLQPCFVAGFSLGANIILKAGGELKSSARQLISAMVAISPAIDLHMSVSAIEQPENHLYQRWFLYSLRRKLKEKVSLFPDKYDISLLKEISTLRAFDDKFTAPAGGYGDANNYYQMASSAPLIQEINVPTLIIAAQDDPLVPFCMFEQYRVTSNPNVSLLSPAWGGHGGFVQKSHEKIAIFDHFWAENRAVQFCQEAAAKSRKLPNFTL